MSSRRVLVCLLLLFVAGAFTFGEHGVKYVLFGFLREAAPDGDAQDRYGAFSTISMFAPLAGALVALKAGPRMTMTAGAFASAFGCLLLAGGASVFLALGVMGLGQGLFVPNLSTAMVSVFPPGKNARRATLLFAAALVSLVAVKSAPLVVLVAGLESLPRAIFIGGALMAIAGGASAALFFVPNGFEPDAPSAGEGRRAVRRLLLLLVLILPCRLSQEIVHEGQRARLVATMVRETSSSLGDAISSAMAPMSALQSASTGGSLLALVSVAIVALVFALRSQKLSTLVPIGGGLLLVAAGVAPLLLPAERGAPEPALLSAGMVAAGNAVVSPFALLFLCAGSPTKTTPAIFAVWTVAGGFLWAMGTRLLPVGPLPAEPSGLPFALVAVALSGLGALAVRRRFEGA